MLNQLIISNYALIDSADIRLENGFTVITGETGAGKSIMLGALSLILGQRSDTSAMRDKKQKCVVEAHFNIEGYGLNPIFTTEDIDYDDYTVIRREILPSGKSRAFVNDTPVTLNFLKKLTQHLIDIHSQHQNLLLGEFTFQLMILDTVAGNDTIKTDYQNEYHKLRQQQKERSKLVEKNEKQKADRDYWEFQVSQLLGANLQEEEQVSLEKELEQLNHIEEIQSALTVGQTLLSEQDPSVVDMLFQINNEISRVAPFISQGPELEQRLKSAYIELKDISVEIAGIATATEFDPQRLRWVQERLDTIYSLQQKHHVDTVKALIEIRQNLEDKLSLLNSFDEQLTKLDQSIKQQLDTVTKLAAELTKRRKSVFQNIKNTIEKQLHELGMPYARFEIAHNQSEQLREDGADEIQFLFTANKNGTLADIPKVASGGEMSRVMLSIKSLLSSTKGLPTIIFDEIDTGVSGEIADKMGRIMQTMANDIQVISITHLPQIAGKGSQHFKVYKNDGADQTISQIKLLNNDERIEEIAGMLSGAKVSKAALTNARDLLGTN
jgi:DNA repair protein RecN (Recombination protein N)